MTTSDGITDSDWEKIRNHAEEIVAASLSDVDNKLLVLNLYEELRKLELIYGRLPSILATKADFTENKVNELSLLKEAYISACEINDNKNKTFISASLVEYYIDDVPDKVKEKFWLKKLAKNLNSYSDSYHESVYKNNISDRK